MDVADARARIDCLRFSFHVMNSSARVPVPVNEPVLTYAPGTRERNDLKLALKDLSSRQIDIPIIIGGKEIRTGRTVDAVMPHSHRHVVAKVHQAGAAEIAGAVAAARTAWPEWSTLSLPGPRGGFLQAPEPAAAARGAVGKRRT